MGDKSSISVRAAAVSSITLLLEAPCTHAVMRTLLPSMRLMINDKSEKVCLSIVKMLIRIKTLRGMKYYHIISVEQLLDRLAVEGQEGQNPKSSVASALTNLMQNSYFPQGEGITGSEQVRRTLTFLVKHPEAAEVFYNNLSSHMSVNSISKLIAMLLKCLTVAVKAETNEEIFVSNANKRASSKSKRLLKNSHRSRGDDYHEVEDDDNEEKKTNLVASNTNLMAGISTTISSLLDSVSRIIVMSSNLFIFRNLMDFF